jgi:hypothetical protein
MTEPSREELIERLQKLLDTLKEKQGVVNSKGSAEFSLSVSKSSDKE